MGSDLKSLLDKIALSSVRQALSKGPQSAEAKAKMAMDLEEKLKDPVSEFRLDVKNDLGLDQLPRWRSKKNDDMVTATLLAFMI